MSIRNWLLGVLCVLGGASLWAQGIVIPNTFVNGTAADATQVNANFSALANNALNRTGGTMTGTLTTLLVQPTVTNASDVGTSSLFYRTGYLRTSLVLGQTSGNYTLTWANPAAARAISFEDPGGTDILVYKAATQTLTNKTISTGSTYNAGAVTSSGIITGTVLHPTAAPAAAGSIGFSGNTLVNQGGTSGHQWANAANDTALMTLSNAGALALPGTVAIGGTNVTDAVATPTLTSVGAGDCGTGATIAGKVYASKITIGTGSPSVCNVSFNMTFANGAVCAVSSSRAYATSIAITGTTTGAVIDLGGGAFTAGDVVSMLCRGY